MPYPNKFFKVSISPDTRSISIIIYQTKYNLCRSPWSTIITQSVSPRYKVFSNSLVPAIYFSLYRLGTSCLRTLSFSQ